MDRQEIQDAMEACEQAGDVDGAEHYQQMLDDMDGIGRMDVGEDAFFL